MPVECKHEQGTLGWLQDRLGVPTASMYKSIITSTGKASATAKTYMRGLLANLEAGKPVDSFKPTAEMKTGIEREPDAADLYEFITDNEVMKTGFWFKDDKKKTGCSPDRLIGDDGLLEIKCPNASTLIGYRLDKKVPTAYIQQIQGQLWVMGRQWCDFLAYHPDIKHFLIRVERDEQYITMLSGAINKFISDMEYQRKQLTGE